MRHVYFDWQSRKRHPRDFMRPGRIRVQFKTPEGTPVISGVTNRSCKCHHAQYRMRMTKIPSNPNPQLHYRETIVHGGGSSHLGNAAISGVGDQDKETKGGWVGSSYGPAAGACTKKASTERPTHFHEKEKEKQKKEEEMMNLLSLSKYNHSILCCSGLRITPCTFLT